MKLAYRLLILLRLLLLVTSATIQVIPDLRITDNEILDLVRDLRENDVNHAHSDQVELDLQGHATSNNVIDHATRKLFKKVDPKLLSQPTYKKFIALLDNFVNVTGITETETIEEKREVDEFIQVVSATAVWQKLYHFLRSKGHPYAKSPNDFRNWVKHLWFSKYSRFRGVADSSGFEYVFVGEVREHEMIGMHSWIRIYLLENEDNQSFDYNGYLVRRNDFLLAAKFTWNKEVKGSSSFLVGTSPEFDLVLYTLCFLSRRGRETCDVEIDGCPVRITSYSVTQLGKIFIDKVYPTAGQYTDSCRKFPRNYS